MRILRAVFRTLLLVGGLSAVSVAQAGSLQLNTRSRAETSPGSGEFRVQHQQVQWDAKRTALVICDMWDKHWCPDATERVGELAPVMNRVVKSARDQGVFIIHCPSDTMGFYQDHPGRKLAQSAPKVETKVPLQGWCSLQGAKEPPLPIDDSDEGCDGCPDCPGYRAWTRQHATLEIMDGDAITDSAEAFYLMRQRGITNVIVMGVHENMCVLGRPFAIRQMVAQGQNVVLMRDMTDSMYHHRKRPFVSHFVGTELICEHIEKYWCASITSTDFIGGAPFRFQGDRRKTIAVITGENEYHTEQTLPAFLKKELEWRGYSSVLVSAATQEGDSNFSNVEAIAQADALLLSTRRRTPSKRMMQLIRDHVAAGKPIVGIRTASHGFDAKPASDAYESWAGFDDEILGADYQGHYNNKPPKDSPTLVQPIPALASHPVLTGVPSGAFSVTSHLYKYRSLAPSVVSLMEGRVEGRPETEPVAWVNTAQDRRVFYTSLGNPADFEIPAFRRLLMNGLLWAMGDFIPPAEAKSAEPKPKPASAPVQSAAAASPAATRPAPSSTPSLDLPQEANAPALSPAEAAKRFKVADDLEWEQVLAEPEIRQPVFLNFDERGRLWVVEYRQYPSPAGLKLLSHDSVWRNVYDKVPPPPPHHYKGMDRISIHEDTNGDGTFDKHATFVDGLNITTAVERGRGGVWVLNPPYLLFYPDANQDDVPDGDPEVRLAGFGLEDTHAVANSLRWGPDGWLYGAQGSTVTANIQVNGADGRPLNSKPIYSQGQNIWRYHPERRVYEVFCEGGGNAFGCELDSQGRIFSGHNGGDTRGFHYVQGGYLQKGFEKHGPLSNPYAYGYFPAMPHHSVPRFTHTFVIYEGAGLPARYQGKLFGVEPLQGRIVESEISRDGSSFRTKDLGRPVTSDDRWFRPVDIKAGPDGALYVCDWYDMQVNHFRNHEGKMDAANGRIYRLKGRGTKATPAKDLSKLSVPETVSLLASPNRWVRQTGQRLLSDRKEAAIQPLLKQGLDSEDGQFALECLWGIYQAGGFTDALAETLLKSAHPQVRAWTVRLLADRREVSPGMAVRLVRLAGQEPDLEVRNQLAASAKRLPAKDSLSLVRELVRHDVDTTDNRQPLLIWWAIEAQCEAHRDEVIALFENTDFWTQPLSQTHLLERTMRRFAQAGTRKDLLACARLFNLSPGLEQSRRLMTGFETAFKGRPLIGMPDELVRAMARHGVGSLTLGIRQQDARAIQRALQRLTEEYTPQNAQLEILGTLSEIKVNGGAEALIRVLRGSPGNDVIRQATINALQQYDQAEIADAVIGLYPRLGREAQASAHALLSSRANWSLQFAKAVQGKKSGWSGPSVKAEQVPLNVVRKMRQHRNAELQSVMDATWPSTGAATTAGMEQKIKHLDQVIRAGNGDPYNGRTLFQNNCGACHKLFTLGAEVGPDLTTYKRDDLESMLLSIVNPNAEVREGYENYTIETRDERSLSGFLVEQDSQTVVLRGLDGQNVALSRKDILELKPAGMSLMPEGLLENLKDEEVRDLFAYLRSTQPLVGSPPKR
ncbi:MAG: ThuA domain-containing protein [Verrucomicrobiales bacterium]|nr:ThuA domain-containing protein [Verrucomicrobiales bacterium]